MKNNMEKSSELDGIKITPVLLGGDLNCYNVARAFHEKYGVCSYAFGRYKIGATEYTKIIKFTVQSDMDNPKMLLKILDEFAEKHAGEKLILIGCTDDYASMIIKNKEYLGKKYITPCTDAALMEDITLKDRFYKYCEKYDIPYPKTEVISPGQYPSLLGFEFPVIIKPSSSVLYWKYPFSGMKKVYRAHSMKEAGVIIDEIYASGYPDRLIVQDTIPGGDSYMYTLTAYCGSDKKVRMMCLGHVLLEEHTPKGMGNHAAILTAYDRPLMEKLRSFLEDIGYVGYANFDIKYDVRDGVYKLFEINVRQGRSNYYVTASGCNIAKYIVDDYILHKPYSGCCFCEEKAYWSYLPLKLVLRYATEDEKEQIISCIKRRTAFSSMRYSHDTFINPQRCFYIAMHEHNQIKKFEKYYPADEVENYNR